MDVPRLLHHAVCGGLAAAGFGVLFNIPFRALAWCAASGGLALAARTIVLGRGWSMEAASFAAALTVGAVVQVLQSRIRVSGNALEVAGCIPMIPGGFATKAILGLFAVMAQHPNATSLTFITALENTLRVMFTIGALGTGLAIPILLLPVRGMK